MKNKGFTLIELLIGILGIGGGGVCVVGYVWNIIKLTSCNMDKIGLELILRVIGIFAVPLGIVLGYIHHF